MGEIENTLNGFDDIREAVVIAREDRPGDQRLVACVVPVSPLPAGQTSGSQEQIRHWKKRAGTTLPDYMVPTDFVVLSALPLTPNGKIDRKALLKPMQPMPSGEGSPAKPKNEKEQLLMSIWTDVLGRAGDARAVIGVEDDFFELGGHSLIAVQVMNRLEAETGRRLPLSTLFAYPTIRKLASLLRNDQSVTAFKSLVPIGPQGHKVPIYIIHGIGLNLLNFRSLVAYMDSEQPIYGLQARGWTGLTNHWITWKRLRPVTLPKS